MRNCRPEHGNCSPARAATRQGGCYIYGTEPLGGRNTTPWAICRHCSPTRSGQSIAPKDRYTATDAEIRDSFLKFLDYCGTYAFHENEGFMLHRVQGSSLPNWVGSVQKRFYVLNGSCLTISRHRFLPRATNGHLSSFGKRLSGPISNDILMLIQVICYQTFP